jgi:hypothetical protein
VTLRAACACAAALAVAAAAPGQARGDALGDAERGVAAVEELLRSVRERAARPEETEPERAGRKYSDGETQYLLGDWGGAALLMAEALDDPGFAQGPGGPTALFYLGDALRKGGQCGPSRPSLEGYLAGGEPAHRGEAITALLDCAVREGRMEAVPGLLAEADRYFQGGLPPELRYLAGKAAYARTDLAAEARLSAAAAAFGAVPAPYQHQAAYYLGAIAVERGDLAGAAARFAACGELPARDARQREVQDLCALGLGRVKTEQDDLPGALVAYGKIPMESPHLEEALYETAAVSARAGQREPALRTAETLVVLSPGSALATQAQLLQGQILLKQGKYEAAGQAYGTVVDTYSSVRDDLDAVLTLHEDPVRYLSDLLGRHGKAPEVASVIPPVAVREALSRRDVAGATELLQAVEGGEKDLAESAAVAERLSALLTKGSGLDAVPALRLSYAGAQAVENAAAKLSGLAATALVEAALPELSLEARDELERVHGERVLLDGRLDALPRTAEAAASRLDRARARIDQLDRQAFQLGYQVDASRAAVAAAEVWLESHRADVKADRTQRDEFTAELRRHREMVDGYEGALRDLRRQIALVRDTLGGAAALDGEARLRVEYLTLLARERDLVLSARGKLSRGTLARLDQVAAVSDRLAFVAGQAQAFEDELAAEATRRAAGLRTRLAAQQSALAAETARLTEVQGAAQSTVGRLAFAAFGDVRTHFYDVVLRADVGLNDVMWVRKKDRVERIQQLSVQKAAELKSLEERYRPLLKEEE